jgi:hypothetical protein
LDLFVLRKNVELRVGSTRASGQGDALKKTVRPSVTMRVQVIAVHARNDDPIR